MFAALIAVLSQLSIPMPVGVPITIQVFAIALTGTVLGSRLGFVTALVYILVGAAGLPVFANFHGGIQSLTGLSGGYILSYPIMMLLCGITPKSPSKKRQLLFRIILATIGLILLETFGGLQWAALSGDKTIGAIFIYSITVFVPKDFLLTVAAVIIGTNMRNSLKNMNCFS